jgi:hypothetical protein
MDSIDGARPDADLVLRTAIWQSQLPDDTFFNDEFTWDFVLLFALVLRLSLLPSNVHLDQLLGRDLSLRR